MQNETWHCLDPITMDFPWKTSSWWQYASLYNTNICLHVNGALTHKPVTHTVCSAAYHDRRVLLHLSLMKFWRVLSVFGTENSTSICPKKQVEIWTHLSTAHISTVFLTTSEMSSGPENLVLSLHKIYAFSLSKREQTLMQQQTVSPMWQFNTTVWWFLTQCYLEGSKVMQIHLRFPPLPYTHWYVSGFLESFQSSWWKT